MSFGFGFGLPHWQALSGGFSPASLFAGGAEGVWYDPSDFSTLFQDPAGTTPVTAVEQPVGLMLDKSQNGVGTNGAKRVNLLTYSEEFDNAAWTKEQAPVNQTIATTDPLGGLTAETLADNATNSRHIIYQTFSGAFNVSRVFSVYAKQNTLRYLAVSIPLTSDTSCYSAIFDLQNGVVSDTKTNGTGTVTALIQSVGNNWYKCSITGIVASSGTGSFFPMIGTSDRPGFTGLLASNNMPAYSGTGQSLYIWGADLRLASEANTQPTYQRITNTWYSTMAGNHAISYNATTARPTLSARVNLLTYSEQFDNGAWTKTNATITADAVANPLTGTVNADALFETTTNGSHAATQSVTTQAASFKYSVYLKANGRARFAIAGSSSFGGNLGSGVFFDLSTGQYVSGAASGATPSITDAGGGWWLVSYEWTANAATGVLGIYLVDSGTNTSYAGDVTKGIYLWGADLRPANIGSAVPFYQRIADANTYDTNGFPKYLYFAGVDDGMSTPANLNLTSTDKVTVFAGVRKLSDAAQGVVAETSSTSINAGAFGLSDPASGSSPNRTYAFRSESAVAISSPEVLAPTTYVSASQANRAAPSIVIQRNGVQVGSTTASQGVGNFGTYPLYIGTRNNAGSWFNGYLYGLTVVGAQLTTPQIESMESWTAGKTGITL